MRSNCSRNAGRRTAVGLGLALIRDGNGARSFETLLRYRGAAMAEFWRALRTLKALQAEQALQAAPTLVAHTLRPTGQPPLAHRPRPNEPERALARPQYILSEPPASGALHEPSGTSQPNEPVLSWRPNEPKPWSEAAGSPGSTRLRDGFHLSRDPAVNYMLFATCG